MPGPALGAVCVGLSALFWFLWPSRIAVAGLARIVLRWGHSGVWAVLALWFFLQSLLPGSGGVAKLLPLLAGLLYAAFIVTLVTAPRQRSPSEQRKP